MKHLCYLLGWIIFLAGCGDPFAQKYDIESPDGAISVRVGLDETGRPFYRVSAWDQAVVDTSYLGFDLNHLPDLRDGFTVTAVSRNDFDETWEQPWGEERHIRNQYRELKLSLRERKHEQRSIDLVFRVFNDGIGFRYEFPEQEHLRNFEILDELTEFHLVGNPQAWWIPAYESNRYEYLYQSSVTAEMGKVHTPVTFQNQEGICLSIHEAALAQYSSMVIDADGGTRLQAELVPYSREEESRAFVSAPGHTPWRTIQIAQKPADLITSYLILNLNEPNQLGDVSWFKPGKYVGIWWEMHIGKGTWASGGNHAATTENAKRYIDFAETHGFDGVLVEGWNTGWDHNWVEDGSVFSFTEAYPDYDLEEISRYAETKGVYLVGHHETSGDVDHYERQMADAFALMDDHGVKAVKTGYVEHGNILANGKFHHGQSYVDHFQKVIKLAAKHKIAVVAHEPIKDTGERRTFPNIISREGARGQEFNAWASDGGNPPNHQTILPFTRYLAGPMDFTPGAFDLRISSKPDNQVNTTLAKQLALYVTIYSPMQMACDLPEHYERYPDAFQFIREVGVDWETTRVLEAEIGDMLAIARQERGTENWFVGAVTDEQSREVNLTLDFLKPDQLYRARIYRDAPDADYQNNPEAYEIEERFVKHSDKIRVWLARSGGAAISIYPVDEQLSMKP
ncbi:glycoside hydrolase family 97 protein [Pontibacter sp. G13]|uniref:glycoside hydrolase family 97 protein n=1 Tax=Pontibacter sp. G13 TaxID=3074898 RepID=UPI00288AFBA1|nr:glycoside hydrolase family 97 protein [Pontibacter sp. G13]WNJ20448.1 glycoside hydrolase family 97 protein [Pontibacter sp. G13]